jgi:ethanolamine utilization protein EutP (predicted NTPase)
MGLASEAVKHILAEAGPKGIVTLSAVDRTAALQLIPVPA